VVDSGADLNAYAQVENTSGCCSPSCSSLPIAEPVSCCSPPTADQSLHARLAELLRRYNVNDYAASVRVFAVKP
jgi:arsenite methyltransferase